MLEKGEKYTGLGYGNVIEMPSTCHECTSGFGWFTVLSVAFVIGQSDYLDFNFTTR